VLENGILGLGEAGGTIAADLRAAGIAANTSSPALERELVEPTGAPGAAASRVQLQELDA
jgi:3-hydroxyisobutyrate dehydrogenase-like beta-hydroxyacid dehydrogenase